MQEKNPLEELVDFLSHFFPVLITSFTVEMREHFDLPAREEIFEWDEKEEKKWKRRVLHNDYRFRAASTECAQDSWTDFEASILFESLFKSFLSTQNFSLKIEAFSSF